MNDQEHNLIQAARNGDQAAYGELVQQYQKRVFALAVRMCPTPELAEEAAQEAFLAAWQGLPFFRGDSAFATWLYRLTSNACVDLLRKENRHQGPSLDDEAVSAEVPDPTPTPEKAVEQQELRRQIEAGLQTLSPEHREVLILREIQQLSYDEIADVLSLDLGTVKSRINRGRRQLREFLLKQGCEMNIHENTALLDAFVDGELTSEEMISVQSHLDECPECRAYVDDALAIRASFPTEDDAELPADFVETVMKAVAETPQSRPKKRQPWGKLAAAAACLAVIVLMQKGTLGSISGSSDTSATCDTAPMEAAAAESAPEERCLTAAGGDNDSDSFADTNTESKKTDVYYACALPPDQTTMENDSAAAMTDGSSAQDDLPTVTVSKSDLGELLDDREPTEVKPGVCRYLLTRQEFEDLAAKLADRGVTLKTEDTDSDQIWLEMLDE